MYEWKFEFIVNFYSQQSRVQSITYNYFWSFSISLDNGTKLAVVPGSPGISFIFYFNEGKVNDKKTLVHLNFAIYSTYFNKSIFKWEKTFEIILALSQLTIYRLENFPKYHQNWLFFFWANSLYQLILIWTRAK